MRLILLHALTLLFSCLPGPLLASPATPEPESMVKNNRESNDQQDKRTASKNIGFPKVAREELGEIYKSVFSYLGEEGGKRSGITNARKEIHILRVEPDPDFPNRRIVHVQPTIRDVPVFGTRVTLVVEPGQGVIRSTSGLTDAHEFANFETIPTIKWLEAVRQAVDVFGQLYGSVEKPLSTASSKPDVEPCAIRSQLVIFDPKRVGLKSGPPRLTWMVGLRSFVIFIDAHDGSHVFQYSGAQFAGRDRWTYDLDGTRSIGHPPVMIENGLVMDEGGSEIGPTSTDMQIAHEAVGKAYDYFQSQFGRDSFDNIGAPIQTNVRYDHDEVKGQWHPVERMLIFGPLVPNALDIVGHEFTHGVIQETAQLGNIGEAGAVNESLADFFGAEIEATSKSHNWTIGETLIDGPLRNMANPHDGGFDRTQPPWPAPPWAKNLGQPDHYSEKVTMADDICGYSPWPENQHECPHLNSGIFNKALHLASDGGDHHNVRVKGVGRTKLARILYRTLVTGLDPLPDMGTTAQAALTSCNDLVGKYDITSADCAEVKNAFVAVGLPVP